MFLTRFIGSFPKRLCFWSVHQQLECFSLWNESDVFTNDNPLSVLKEKKKENAARACSRTSPLCSFLSLFILHPLHFQIRETSPKKKKEEKNNTVFSFCGLLQFALSAALILFSLFFFALFEFTWEAYHQPSRASAGYLPLLLASSPSFLFAT